MGLLYLAAHSPTSTTHAAGHTHMYTHTHISAQMHTHVETFHINLRTCMHTLAHMHSHDQSCIVLHVLQYSTVLHVLQYCNTAVRIRFSYFITISDNLTVSGHT